MSWRNWPHRNSIFGVMAKKVDVFDIACVYLIRIVSFIWFLFFSFQLFRTPNTQFAAPPIVFGIFRQSIKENEINEKWLLPNNDINKSYNLSLFYAVSQIFMSFFGSRKHYYYCWNCEKKVSYVSKLFKVDNVLVTTGPIQIDRKTKTNTKKQRNKKIKEKKQT